MNNLFYDQILKYCNEEYIEERFNLDNLDLNHTEVKDNIIKYNVYSNPFFEINICWATQNWTEKKHFHQNTYQMYHVISGIIQLNREKDICSNNYIIKDLGTFQMQRKAEIYPLYRHYFKAIEPSIFVEFNFVKCKKEDVIYGD